MPSEHAVPSTVSRNFGQHVDAGGWRSFFSRCIILINGQVTNLINGQIPTNLVPPECWVEKNSPGRDDG